MSTALKESLSNKLYTLEEYLSFEEKTDNKHEYQQGHIVAMAGASIEHNRIALNLGAELRYHLKDKPCNAFVSDLRVSIEEKNIFAYPDVMVVCDEAQFFEERDDTIVNPTIVVEILSKSTQAYDHTDKFHAYWTLASLLEYVLIDQYRIQIEYFRRVDEKRWELLIFNRLEDDLIFKSIDIIIPLAEIYRDVTFPSST